MQCIFLSANAMNQEVLSLYFVHGYIPAPYTIYQDIFKLEAGTILTQNKFEKVDIYGVNINIVLDDKAEVAEIISAAVREKEAAPGDTVHIDVQLQPYRAPKVTKTVLFKIPKEQREGKLPLTVRGGSSLAWIQNLLRKQREEGVPAQQKDNRKTLNDFIKRKQVKRNECYMFPQSG